MCGIVGYTGGSNASSILLSGLRRLEYRGYDSAGIAVNSESGLRMIKASGQLDNLIAKVKDSPLTGTAGIGHTRWATHGAPTDTNAHPHMSNDGRFAIVHNGIIENYAALREELTACGFKFSSETDTEVIVHLLEHYYTGNARIAVLKTVSRLEGSYAIGVVCADYPDRLFAAKFAAPMILGIGAGENFFASDVTALVSHTKNVIYMEDGEFAELSPESIEVFDCTGRTVEKSISRVVWDVEAAEKGGFEHFMLKEIMEQPDVIRSTVRPRVRDGRIDLGLSHISPDDIMACDRIFIVACGSASYVGQVAKHYIERYTRIPVTVELASEFRYSNPIVTDRTIAIVISQSGETIDTLFALREAKSRGAHVLSIVNVVGSTIANESEDVIYTWAGPEIAVATTKAYSAQLSVCYLLALYMGHCRHMVSDSELKDCLNAIEELPGLMRSLLEKSDYIKYLASLHFSCRNIYFIGRNIDHALALEGSLKLKEISYIFSEAYPAGELKHGTISLIEPGSLVVALCTYSPLTEKMISNMREVKARGAVVLALATEGTPGVEETADQVMWIPKADPFVLPSLAILPLQLFAYYVALLKGCDIDKPRNLAKSVTVE